MGRPGGTCFDLASCQRNRGFRYKYWPQLVSGEGCDSPSWLDYVLPSRSDLFKSPDVILGPNAGSKYGDVIEMSEEQLFKMKFKITGRFEYSGHPCRKSKSTAFILDRLGLANR
jgi:hypothetical protein